MLRDVMDIAGRDPWSFPPFDSRDPEGEDVRAAAVGHLTAVYWVNRTAGRLYIIANQSARLKSELAESYPFGFHGPNSTNSGVPTTAETFPSHHRIGMQSALARPLNLLK